MRYLTFSEILYLHGRVLAASGGAPARLRSVRRLNGTVGCALTTPFQAIALTCQNVFNDLQTARAASRSFSSLTV